MLQRLGLRMYVVSINSSTRCEYAAGFAGSDEHLRFGDEIVGANGQAIAGLSSDDVAHAIDQGMSCFVMHAACFREWPDTLKHATH